MLLGKDQPHDEFRLRCVHQEPDYNYVVVSDSQFSLVPPIYVERVDQELDLIGQPVPKTL